jgi:hypothetical protein
MAATTKCTFVYQCTSSCWTKILTADCNKPMASDPCAIMIAPHRAAADSDDCVQSAGAGGESLGLRSQSPLASAIRTQLEVTASESRSRARSAHRRRRVRRHPRPAEPAVAGNPALGLAGTRNLNTVQVGHPSRAARAKYHRRARRRRPPQATQVGTSPSNPREHHSDIEWQSIKPPLIVKISRRHPALESAAA